MFSYTYSASVVLLIGTGLINANDVLSQPITNQKQLREQKLQEQQRKLQSNPTHWPTSAPTPNPPTVVIPSGYSLISYIGNNLSPGSYGHCEGDCDTDDDCKGDLICGQRDGFETIPGCVGRGDSGTDYCRSSDADLPDLVPTQSPIECGSTHLVTLTNDLGPSKYGLCEGDCDNDSDCIGDLICEQRNGYTAIPGCCGLGECDSDYCREPGAATNQQPSSQSSTQLPTGSPSFNPSSKPVANANKPIFDIFTDAFGLGVAFGNTETESPTIVPTPKPTAEPTPSPTNSCGNSICDKDETPDTCPADCIAQTFNTNSEKKLSAGCQMFSVEATKDLIVTSFQVVGRKDGESDAVIFTRVGGYQGYESDGAGWELIYDEKVEITKNRLSDIGPLNKNVPIRAGSEKSFYLCVRNGLMYGTGNDQGSPENRNGSLLIKQGVAAGNPFQEVTGAAKFNGGIRYFLSASSVENV